MASLRKKMLLCILFAFLVLFIIYCKYSNNNPRHNKCNTYDTYELPLSNVNLKVSSESNIESKNVSKSNISNTSNIETFQDKEMKNVQKIGEQINMDLIKNTKKEKELQKKYSLTYGTYKYNILEGEQPIQGLYVDYDREYETTLPKICNKMVVEPDLDFPYANLLSR